MKVSRSIWWALLACASLGVAVGWIALRQPGSSELPPLARHHDLPDAFHQRLQEAYREAREQRLAPDSLRAIARLYHANRRFAEAEACYRVIAAAPGGLQAQDHYYLADIARNQGDLGRAEEEFRTVVRQNPGYVPARAALAETLFKSGQSEAAAREFAAVLAADPAHLRASLGLARLELQAGNEAAAVRRLEDLLARHPEATAAAATLAPILERRGETDRARALTQWSLQRPDPIAPDPWMSDLLTDVYDVQRLSLEFEQYSRTGQMDQAMRFVRRIEELDPKSPAPQILRGWAQAQAREELDAVREFRRALQKGGDPDQILPYLIPCLLTLGDVAEASKIAEEHHRRAPESVPVATAYADVAIRQGHEKLARELLGKVLDKQPYQVAQNMSLAKILWSAGEHEAAAQCLLRVARAVPADIASRALLGEYYLARSEPTTAIGFLEQASRHAGDQPVVRQRLNALLVHAYLEAAAAETARTRFAEAADYYDEAIELAPAELNAHAGKANAAVQLRRFRAAADALERMAAIQPGNPTIHLSLGDVLYLDGRVEQAKARWAEALKLTGTSDVELRAALEERLSGRITEETFR